MLKKIVLLTGLLLLLTPTFAFAADGDEMAVVTLGLNSIWVMLAAILVLFMQGGFVLLESGSTRMKNAGHVAGKTVFTLGLCTLIYWAVGYSFMFGADKGKFIGIGDFFFNPGSADALPPSIFFLFQFAFAAISLTIVWGGFAERAKLMAYVIFTVLFTALVYPVIGHWIWGGGWLAQDGAQDFAGSTVVHLTGALAALAGTILLKPRIGKYNKDGSANPILGHNQVFTVLGVVILWIGWFGFNAGSTVAVGDGFFGYVAFNTQLAAGAGAVAGLFISWILAGKADIGSMLNGALAGLVAITASCAFVDPWAAVVIGAVAGVLCYLSVIFFEKIRIDDPIFALSVHGAAGIWGTLANGIFATDALAKKVGVGEGGLIDTGSLHQLWVQFLSIISAGGYAFVLSFVILLIMKISIGLRVTEEEEIIGLDLSEHGVYGYPEQMKKAGQTSNIGA